MCTGVTIVIVNYIPLVLNAQSIAKDHIRAVVNYIIILYQSSCLQDTIESECIILREKKNL